MWPISKWADVPYYGRATHENKRRSHQGALFMQAALRYVQAHYSTPYCDAPYCDAPYCDAPYCDASTYCDALYLL